MTTQDFTEQSVRYFLGELSEAEKSAVETRFFGDEDYSRFLDQAENDLIDDYVGGKLGFRQTRNFDRSYLISERRSEKVRAARMMQTEISAEKHEIAFPFAPFVFLWQQFENLFRVPNSIWAGGLAAIAVLILLAGLRLISSPEANRTAQIEPENQTVVESAKSSWSSTSLPTSEEPRLLNKIQKQIVRREKSKLAAKPNAEPGEKAIAAPPVKTAKPIPALTLLPAQSAEKPPVVGAARGAENIRLRVVHRNAENFVKYLVAIRAADGDLIWSREITVSEKTAQKPLALDVRSGALASGSYGLTVSGATGDGQLEEVNTYNFTVEKK